MQPKTEETMTAVTLYGRTYEPDENGIVTIPCNGYPCTVRLVTEGLKRKDWYYETMKGGTRHMTIEFKHLLESLTLIIPEDDLL